MCLLGTSLRLFGFPSSEPHKFAPQVTPLLAGVRSSVLNFSPAAGRPPTPGCWFWDLAGACGMNANEKAPGAGVHLGQAVGKFIVSSPLPSPLCLSQQAFSFALAGCSTPFPCALEFIPPLPTCCTFLGRSAGNILEQTLLSFGPTSNVFLQLIFRGCSEFGWLFGPQHRLSSFILHLKSFEHPLCDRYKAQ